jgi:DNA-binding transcriptional ArsR family regulator
MTSSTADDVFGALADATRRAILDLLRDNDHLTAGQIADRFPRLSRPAVSKHLRVARPLRTALGAQPRRPEAPGRGATTPPMTVVSER